MPRSIIKLKDQYLEWSTVVDAPVTTGMTLKDFKVYYRNEYGEDEMRGLEERLTRVDLEGVSSRLSSLDEMLSYNRAGKNETTLTADQIYDFYCVRQCEGRKPEGVQEEG